MYLTAKQINLLTVIAEGHPDESLLDLDEITEKAAHRPSKASLQFSIRALIKHGLIEKADRELRRGRSRQTIRLTALGEHHVSAAAAKTAPAFVSSIEDDELLRDFE